MDTYTYPLGTLLVVTFIFVVFFGIAIMDFVCALNRWPSIGFRVQGWSRKNPWFVAVLLLILATLLTHFLANNLS